MKAQEYPERFIDYLIDNVVLPYVKQNKRGNKDEDKHIEAVAEYENTQSDSVLQ